MSRSRSRRPKTCRKITFCLWQSQSGWRKTTRFPFMQPKKMMSDYAGLHASLLLFEAPSENARDYPFHKNMPRNANPKFDVTSEFKGREILCCDGRGNVPVVNEDVIKVDSYVNFIPQQGETSSFKEHKFKSYARSSDVQGKKFNFIDDPYEEACEEYFEYRHGREERLPEQLLAIPVKTQESDGLDYDKICMWWALVNKSDTIQYNYFTENCAYGVLQALRAGGAERFLKFRTSDFFPVTPNKVSTYTKNLEGRMSGEYTETTFEMVCAYIKKLIDVITNKNSDTLSCNTKNETYISSYFSLDDFLQNDRYDSYGVNNIKKEIAAAENTQYADVRAFHLRRAQSLCAELLFYEPDTPAFNLIANVMSKIDKEKLKDPEHFMGDLNELVINLKIYAESTSKKYGIFTRESKREVIKTFYKNNPDPGLDDYIKLKEKLAHQFRSGDADKLIDKIILQEQSNLAISQHSQP